MATAGPPLAAAARRVAPKEVRPFADRRAASGARRLGLTDDAKAIARLVDDQTVPVLVAALVRLDFARGEDEVLAAARETA